MPDEWHQASVTPACSQESCQVGQASFANANQGKETGWHPVRKSAIMIQAASLLLWTRISRGLPPSLLRYSDPEQRLPAVLPQIDRGILLA